MNKNNVASIRHNLNTPSPEFWKGVAEGFAEVAAYVPAEVLEAILRKNERFHAFIDKLPEV